MPPKRSDNTEAINLKIPKSWVDVADKLRRDGTMPVVVTRTAMFRAALGYGLELLSKEGARHLARQDRRRRRRVVEASA